MVWTEVTRWAAEPRRLHRSYTVDYLRALLETGLPVPFEQASRIA
ncbi:hypothetical protein ACIBO5_57740 [Nonomuraea angiospora]|nr:hypothetical protein [Nonomuraea angiospora]MDX3110014.1 hypothetical protein [Nonomuraea angiospora]